MLSHPPMHALERSDRQDLPSKHSWTSQASLPTFIQNIALKECGFGRCRAAQKDGSILLVAMFFLLNEVSFSTQLLLDVFKGSDLVHCFLNIEDASVIGVELGQRIAFCLTLLEILIIVESAVVGRYSVKVTHILSFSAFLVSEKCFVHLFSVSDSDDLDFGFSGLRLLVGCLTELMLEEFLDSFCLCLDGAGWSFLNEDIAILAMLEGEEDEVNGFFEGHDEAGHLRFGEGDRVAVADLVDPEGDDGTT